MIIVECPICKTRRKTYQPRFHCCHTRHNSEDNRINKPIHPAKQEEKIPTPDVELDLTKKEGEGASNQAPEPLENSSLVKSEEPKELNLEDKNMPEEFKYKCGVCGIEFNDLDDGCCPECEAELNEDIEDD